MKTKTKLRENKLQEDIEQINRRIQELLNDLLKLPEKLLKDMPQKLGSDFSALGGMKGQAGVDPYRILGLDKTASDEEVKKRYLELVHVLHPDKSGTPATGLFFQMVNAAFQSISNERG